MRGLKHKERIESGSGEGFLSGVLVLSMSTLIVKIIGLVSKIPMIAHLGAEGMGYFNSAYEIYAMLCVISTAGLPVALSMLISESRERGEPGEIRRIYRVARRVFLLLGATGSLLMIGLARPLSVWIGNENAYLCILAIAPALFFVCLSCAVRGYFQGFHRMAPTALSQLIEAVGKLIFGIGFAAWARARGMELPVTAACAILGLSLGCLLSALYLLLLRARSERGRWEERPSSSNVHYGGALLRIALPITLSSAVLSVTRLVDMALIMRRLQDTGVSAAESNRIFGAYTTLALPVFGLIPSLITPIALALVPKLTAAIEGGAREEQIQVGNRALRLTVLLSLPASLGVVVYAKPILGLLFRNEPDSVALTAPLLSILGGSILFSGLITTTNGILQSYRRPWKPILSMAIGAGVKLVSAYVLIGIPSIGVRGAPISTFLCNVTVTLINLRCLRACVPKGGKETGIWALYGKPLLASCLAILASLSLYLPLSRMSGEELAFVGAAAVAVIVYGAMAILLRIVTAQDLDTLPSIGHRKTKTRRKLAVK